jgi:hypothetical protein
MVISFFFLSQEVVPTDGSLKTVLALSVKLHIELKKKSYFSSEVELCQTLLSYANMSVH